MTTAELIIQSPAGTIRARDRPRTRSISAGWAIVSAGRLIILAGWLIAFAGLPIILAGWQIIPAARRVVSATWLDHAIFPAPIPAAPMPIQS